MTKEIKSIKTYKQILESPIIRGKFTSGFESHEDDWKQLKDTKYIKLVRDKLGARAKYKVYKTDNQYFLVSNNEEYLGYIEYEKIDNKKIQIISSSSEIKGGFYNIMFMVILSDNIEQIISDNKISKNALNSYKNLNNFSIKLLWRDEYFNIDNEEILNKKDSRISIKEDFGAENLFIEYYSRLDKWIEQGEFRSSWNRQYFNNDTNLDLLVFGQIIE
jgi:hypothetical protein